MQRQQAHREANNLQPTHASPSSGPRRHSNQQGGLFSSSTSTILNGNSPVMQKTHSPVVTEVFKGPKVATAESLRRESAIQAS
jgi:hypothetical protein